MTHKKTQRGVGKPAQNRVNLTLPDSIYGALAKEAGRKAVGEATLVKMLLAERYQAGYSTPNN